MTWRTDIGEQVRDRREALGLTQRQLGARAGVCPRSISRIERGEAMTMRTLDEILRVLGCYLVVEVVR